MHNSKQISLIAIGITLIIIGNVVALIGVNNQFSKPGPYAWANVNPLWFTVVFFIFIMGWFLGLMCIAFSDRRDDN